MRELLSAIKASEGLTAAGTVTEYLPNYAELTFTFKEGLTARIADHGNGKFQMTLDGFYHLEPASADRVVAYLASI